MGDQWSAIAPPMMGDYNYKQKFWWPSYYVFFDGVLDKEPILSRASKFPQLILFLCWYPKLCRPLLTDIFPTDSKKLEVKQQHSLSVFMWPRVEIWRAALFESGQGPKGHLRVDTMAITWKTISSLKKTRYNPGLVLSILKTTMGVI